MVQQIVGHPYHGILLGNKREQSIGAWNHLSESLGNYANWKKANAKGYTLDDSTPTTFLKRQNYRNGKQITIYQGLGTVKEQGRWWMWL